MKLALWQTAGYPADVAANLGRFAVHRAGRGDRWRRAAVMP